MTKRPRAEAIGGIGHVRLIEHAAQAETGTGQQGLVFAVTVFAGQFFEHFTFEQAAIEQACVETGQAARVAMTIGSRLLHAPPFRFVGAGQHRRRISKGASGHGGRFAHSHLQQTLGRGIADIALAASNMRHAVELCVSQTDVEIQPQRLGDTGDDGIARPTTVSTTQQLPTSQP